MSEQAIQHLQLMGNYAPVPEETEAFDIKPTVGTIPPELNGVLYRNGANPMYPPLTGDHHWFLAEGMIHALSIRDGKVSYRNRWVETAQVLAQREAGQRLVATGLVDPTPEENAHIPRHFAATHVLFHGGRLLALDEWAGPAALDADTLETVVESFNFDGRHVGALTAHPKVDPDSGEMLGFGYQAAGIGSPVMSFSRVDKNGNFLSQELFDVPFCSIAHDFGFTEHHVIFPLFSADISMARVMEGGPLGAYDPKIQTQIGIMRRDQGASSMRWFKGEPCYAFHTMNSFEEVRDNQRYVVLDMMKYPHLPLFPYLGKAEIPEWIRDGDGVLVRWTFNLDSDSENYTEEVLTSLPGEFPVIDERYAGKPYSVGFYAARTSPWVDGTYYDTVAQINLETRVRKDYFAGEGRYLLEPIFAPKSQDAVEGDGWILTVVYDSSSNSSELVILDAKHVDNGPVAVVPLPNRIPYGFHGSWRSRV